MGYYAAQLGLKPQPILRVSLIFSLLAFHVEGSV